MFVRAPLPYNKEIYRAWYIRKDWLDKLKLPVPQNYDEYLTAIRAFTDNDPDGNGKKDTFGFSTAGSGTEVGYDWPEYVKNGLTHSVFIENNKFIDSQTDLRNEKVLSDIAKVIEEGLVDPDWFLNKSPQHIDKAAQGKIGVILGGSKNFAYDSNTLSLQSKTKSLFPEANWVPFTPFGNTPLQTGVAPGSPFLFHKNIVEKKPEKVKRITEILDWLAGEEGFLLTHYGQEGKHYTRQGSVITLNSQAFDEDVIKKDNWLGIWDFFTPDTPNTFKLEVVDSRQTERDREIAKKIAAFPKGEYIGTSLTPPPGFDLAAFRTRQRELQVKAIFEDKSGKNWPAYHQELMSKYKGVDLYTSYTNLVKAAGAIK
jgi:ABC-type glycerol-3-phosphate transport system substrate-binding protein